jgi:hypothetical protein
MNLGNLQMSSLKRVYRTLDGSADFAFTFTTRPFSNQVRIYITDMPAYGSRDTDGHSTHRFRDPNGAPYVCYDPMPTNLTDAFQIAKVWAESTWNYIRTGQRF